MTETPTTMLNATPIELPLPGGQPGANVVLHPLLCAEMSGPLGWFHRAEGPTAVLKALGIGVPKEQIITIPIPAFLVEHPSAGPILIDTGFHRSVAFGSRRERTRNLGLIGSVMGRNVSMRPEQTVAAQLSTRGIDPSDVALIVMTHLHFDHASALADFPNATVLVSEPEWRSARGRDGFLKGYSTAQLDARLTYRTVAFTAPGASPRGPFAQTLDVFGDGSITLAFTPGHSAGHLSVVLRLSTREALVAGDALYTLATLRDGRRPWRSEDKRAFEHSIATIQAYDREHPDAVIIPGHDMDSWHELAERYS